MANEDMDALRDGKLPDHVGWFFTKTIHNELYPSIDPTKATLPDGYTVLVTGAGHGIGEYIARSFALAKASNILISARTTSDLEKVKKEIEKIASGQGRSINVSAVTADATKPDDYAKLADVINSKYGGRLDCLVCNAGGGTHLKTIWSDKLADHSVEDITGGVELNFLAAFYAAKYLVPLLLNGKGKGKLLINITSAASHFTTTKPLLYNIAKLALNRLTEGLSSNYAEEGLTGVSIHPGGVVTPGVEESVAAQPWLKDLLKDDIGLCGAMCVWLASRDSIWLSGRYIAAAWDVDELQAKKDEIVEKDKLKWRMVV